MKLGGIIYLLSIADKRMKGTTLKNLEMFSQLCGDKALARVILGTTNWGEVNEAVGAKREQQLDKTFWSTMTASGSKSMRFLRTQASALVFLDAILNKLEFGADERILNVTRDRVIKTGDSVMVGGRSTDIVIPCDSIYRFFIS
jgi:tRNA G37 N-methylase TrmD